MLSHIKKDYKNQLKENDKYTYAQYIAKSGSDAENSHLDAMAEATAKRDISSVKLGAKASGLSDIGLSNSGYAEYLEGLNSDIYNDSLSLAKRQTAVDNYKNASGYEKYLSEYEKLQTQISDSVISEFGSGSSLSLEDAYRRAIEAGVNETYALYTATRARSAAVKNAIEKAISFAKYNSLSPKAAKEYAISLGLSERYANKVYDSISTFTDEQKYYYSSMSPEEYYDYISSKTQN